MKRYNGQTYKTISIIGSFRKQMNAIKKAKDVFESNGFEVIVPKSTKLSGHKNSSYVLLDTDKTKSPRKLESDYLDALLEADVVYCCNEGGYIGGTAMFELGYLIAKGQEVYFQESPQEDLISDLIIDRSNVCSPKRLSEKLLIENEVWESREWFDADREYKPGFSFNR